MFESIKRAFLKLYLPLFCINSEFYQSVSVRPLSTFGQSWLTFAFKVLDFTLQSDPYTRRSVGSREKVQSDNGIKSLVNPVILSIQIFVEGTSRVTRGDGRRGLIDYWLS